MKQNINLGAYGWRHAHWLTTFYPDDLPVEAGEDWRLAYYSNEFASVLVPCSYWQTDREADCESWLDDVHADFRFFIECSASMFVYISPSELMDCLSRLQPQLSALVFMDEKQTDTESLEPFAAIIDSLALDVFTASDVISNLLEKPVQNIWRPEYPQMSSLAFIENDLSDLRSVRMLVDDFVAASAGNRKKTDRQKDEGHDDLSFIVSHPQLQASDLNRFRSALEIMGY